MRKKRPITFNVNWKVKVKLCMRGIAYLQGTFLTPDDPTSPSWYDHLKRCGKIQDITLTMQMHEFMHVLGPLTGYPTMNVGFETTIELLPE